MAEVAWRIAYGLVAPLGISADRLRTSSFEETS